MSGSRFPWFPVLVLAATMVWAACGSGAASSRDAAGWDTPTLLAQVTPGGTEEGGEDEEEEFDPSDTLGVEEDEPLNPDTTQTAPPPSVPSTSPSDTASAAPPDTLRPPPAPFGTAPTDTAATPTFIPSAVDTTARSARRDTVGVRQPGPPAPPPQPKKPRSGILGIHPIAILLGLAVLHYFVTKSAGD